ncbi:predicted protein [Pyrenophora tritici-repentis Pt-1C-BFP]|uniref:Uncharacterized protein n=1 Tax=Pyrenophora tritici-repentis (strain Pt-1C-BFP) TaxID=426418 RepID=B2WIV7_PYRTR|nr:uncharacterized protein PTRG_09916 [Pyrenophora tritici-repentis Pt-1C-BFP]EDU42967.1 predicted protein [Pyrenophora tritici-repentis Pt-1C-BFP]
MARQQHMEDYGHLKHTSGGSRIHIEASTLPGQVFEHYYWYVYLSIGSCDRLELYILLRRGP